MQSPGFDTKTSIVNQDNYFYGFMIFNTVNIALPVSKLIVIYTELEESGADGLFMLNTQMGQANLELELYPDIA